MKKPRRSVFVNGHSYPVREMAGYLKADLGGAFGWTSVWAMDGDNAYTALVRRIRWALSGGQ